MGLVVSEFKRIKLPGELRLPGKLCSMITRAKYRVWIANWGVRPDGYGSGWRRRTDFCGLRAFAFNAADLLLNGWLRPTHCT
jgi:hypothetical protein